MSRSMVTMREATLEDIEQLALLWQPYLRRGPGEDTLQDLRTALDHLAERPDQRLVVAEYDGDFAGAVFLQTATYSPVNLDPVLQVYNVAVVAAHRRHGVGKALMECGVTWAEELGIGHVATAASSGSREANRFMARLALGPAAVLRIAPTHAVRSRLAPRHAAARQVTQVLAARRSLRSGRSTVGGLQ
jgi:ribosomal protein S18 acetylase RimI-like enzyme